MDPRQYGAPMGFPNHAEFQFYVLRKEHFQQYIIARFGTEFLREVESSPNPLFLPIVTYAHKWIVSFYVFFWMGDAKDVEVTVSTASQDVHGV